MPEQPMARQLYNEGVQLIKLTDNGALTPETSKLARVGAGTILTERHCNVTVTPRRRRRQLARQSGQYTDKPQ
jgi:hypothetical protein